MPKNHLSLLNKPNFTISIALIKFVISCLVAFSFVFVPEYQNLSVHAQSMFFILVLAAMLWITEAIPAFAVSFLIIGLEILLLGFDNFDFTSNSKEWVYYLKPWSSPLLFLFIAGFIMAIATSKTKLDLWLAKRVLSLFGNKPHNILSGLMLVTFVLSMFISNTATTAMMMTMLIPILKHMKKGNPFIKGILLGVVVAANIGGMGTIIGTPPNAIAVGTLGDNAPSFLGWMFYALPPAVMITLILRFIILKLYPSNEEFIDLSKIDHVKEYDDSTTEFNKQTKLPSWKKTIVILVLMSTILLWLTGPFHHIPTTVVSFLPIVVLSVFKIIDVEDIQEIRWDVIILIIGGLSLGLGVVRTELDTWLGTQLSITGLNIYFIVAIFSFIIVIVSNFMSNTAATNILLPIVIALVTAYDNQVVSFLLISIALCASCAMILPVSTPPNAIAFASGRIVSKDFLIIGLFSAIIGPFCIILYLALVS